MPRPYVRRIGFFKDIRVPEAERAWATIDSVRETGPAEGDDAVLVFDLTLDVPGRERYRAAHSQVVPRRALGELKPGTRVAVRVDPDDLTEILIS